MADGWITIHRKIFESELWLERPFSKGQAWIDLLMLANFDDGNVVTSRGAIVKLKRGQCVVSMLELSARWGWERRKTKRFFVWLRETIKIEFKIVANRFLVTICNYDKYQQKNPMYTEWYTERYTEDQNITSTTQTICNNKNSKKNDERYTEWYTERYTETQEKEKEPKRIKNIYKINNTLSPTCARGKIDAKSIDEIYSMYPKKTKIMEAKKAIMEAVGILAENMGGDSAAIEYLKKQTASFAEIVAEWPITEKRFCPSPEKFYQDGSYQSLDVYRRKIPASCESADRKAGQKRWSL